MPDAADQARPPSPALFLETATAHQRSAALKAAVELDLFTALAEGTGTVEDTATRCGAAPRGVRILCDYLTTLGFLTKTGDRHALTRDSARFLDRRSPAYLGGTLEFTHSKRALEYNAHLTDAVRRGGAPPEGALAEDHPAWEQFARAMAPMMVFPAELLARLVSVPDARPIRVLDIAAGHGFYGIAFAKRYPNAGVVGLDWPRVLEVARENAQRAGVADRYELLPGSAFDVDFGQGRGVQYDLVLLPNFLHHFDQSTCESLLRKVHDALAEGGRVVTLDYVPDEDRIHPPNPAQFALTMLANTPAGDAYTFKELEAMFQHAGFTRNALHELLPTDNRVVISER